MKINAAKFFSAVFAAILCGLVVSMLQASAFNGPSQSPPSGAGALGSNSANNVSIGTSTPANDTKLYIIASSTNSSEYSVRVLQPNGGPILLARNDGTVSIGTTTNSGTLTVGGNIYANGSVVGGTMSAANINAGTFASGNFAFPANLGVNTSTAVGLPANFTVYGTSENTGTSTFLGQVEIGGATNPAYALDVTGDIRATGNFHGAPQQQTFLIENPGSSEDDAVITFNNAVTIDAVYGVNKSSGDTVTFNLVYAASRSQSVGTASALFSSYQTNTATGAATKYTSFANSTPAAGSTLRFVTNAASSSQFLVTIWFHAQ